MHGGPLAAHPLPSIRPCGIRLSLSKRLRRFRIRFEDTFTSYCTLLMNAPVAGLGALVEGADGRGQVFQIIAAQRIRGYVEPAIRERMHRFRCAGEEIPRLQ